MAISRKKATLIDNVCKISKMTNSPWLGEGLRMPSPNYPVLCCLPPYRVDPVFVQVISPSLSWSPLSSFLVIWSPSGDTRGPSVVFEAVNMPCPEPFHFSHSVDYIYDFCPLPDPDVGPSIFACDVEHTSFHFWSVRPQVCSVLVWSVSRSLHHICLGMLSTTIILSLR